MIDAKTGNTVRFSIYGLLNNKSNFEGKVVAISTAEGLPPESNAVINHSNIWPTVDGSVRETVSDAHTAYDYIHLQDDSGKIYYVGILWIKEVTYEIVTSRSIQITVANFTDTDYARVIAALESREYEVDKIVPVD